MTIAERALAGLPLDDCFVVDAHMHNGRVSKFFSRFDHYRDLILQMDAIGIRCGIVSNLWTSGELWQAHPELLSMCRAYPGRFFGFLAPNPNAANFQSELAKYAENPVFIGIKLHPAEHKKDFLCGEYRYAYAFAAERKLPVLLHTWGAADILRFSEIAKLYPETALVLGHSGGEEAAVKEAIQVAADHENIYLDTACSYVWQGAIEAMVSGATARKIVFGSDAYWNSMEAAVGRVALANITEEEKRLILGENAMRIYRLRGERAWQ